LSRAEADDLPPLIPIRSCANSLLIRLTLVLRHKCICLVGLVADRSTHSSEPAGAGEERLNIFRAVDANPWLPDPTRTAAALSRVSVEVTKEMRQRGKVSELAWAMAETRRAAKDGRCLRHAYR
jgi:hypothetical protein